MILHYLFFLLSNYRWDLLPGGEESGSKGYTAKPMKVVVVSKVPSTRLRISDSGEHLAVGVSDGSVVVVRTSDLKKV